MTEYLALSIYAQSNVSTKSRYFFIVAFITTEKIWNQPNCLSTDEQIMKF